MADMPALKKVKATLKCTSQTFLSHIYSLHMGVFCFPPLFGVLQLSLPLYTLSLDCSQWVVMGKNLLFLHSSGQGALSAAPLPLHILFLPLNLSPLSFSFYWPWRSNNSTSSTVLPLSPSQSPSSLLSFSGSFYISLQTTSFHSH